MDRQTTAETKSSIYLFMNNLACFKLVWAQGTDWMRACRQLPPQTHSHSNLSTVSLFSPSPPPSFLRSRLDKIVVANGWIQMPIHPHDRHYKLKTNSDSRLPLNEIYSLNETRWCFTLMMGICWSPLWIYAHYSCGPRLRRKAYLVFKAIFHVCSWGSRIRKKTHFEKVVCFKRGLLHCTLISLLPLLVSFHLNCVSSSLCGWIDTYSQRNWPSVLHHTAFWLLICCMLMESWMHWV